MYGVRLCVTVPSAAVSYPPMMSMKGNGDELEPRLSSMSV